MRIILGVSLIKENLKMYRTVYSIRDNETITFLELKAAEEYLIANYPEHFMTKDSAIEMSDNMIVEDIIATCEGCGDREIKYSDEFDKHWKRFRCCDVWYCHEDCHG